jgi:hypothetical protein
MKKCKKESRPDKPALLFPSSKSPPPPAAAAAHSSVIILCVQRFCTSRRRALTYSQEAHQSVLQLPWPKTELTMREAAAAIALLLLVASSINGEGTILKF